MKKMKYNEVACKWPAEGRHLLAQFDDESVIVYQAYRREIGEYAVRHQKFGGAFSFARMSWIKPNFLWMMYRSGWASKKGQEMVLAITIPRSFFDGILAAAVVSSFDESRYGRHDEWKTALKESEVRLQWDPDHDPLGKPLKRRAIQLGLRGQMLRRYAEEEILGVEDVSDWAREQWTRIDSGDLDFEVSCETLYFPKRNGAAEAIGLEVAV